jgi:hypothetical protein
MGRPTKYRRVYCDKVVEHTKSGASLTSFAAEIGVSRDTISEWMSKHPEFSVACARAKACSGAWWERQGRIIAEKGGGPGSATIVMFGMKNMGAEDWKDSTQIDHRSGDGSMTPRGLADFYAPVEPQPDSE